MSLTTQKCIGTWCEMWMDNCYGVYHHSAMQAFAFATRVLCKENEYIGYNWGRASFHTLGRNQLEAEALGDWLFYTDTDHMFSPDVLIRLLDLKERTGALVVSGIYQTKLPPHRPLVNFWGPANAIVPMLDWDREAFEFEVGSVGGGCLLIDKKALKIIRQKFPTENPFDQIGKYSEDYSFCLRCKEAGIPIILGPQIQFHHVITVPVDLENYVRPAEAIQADVSGGSINSKID